jgi:tRNA(fMet)-specific endonuclease VapC
MLRYMLDTNICIYVIKNRPARLRDRFNDFADQLCVSVITLAELIYGAEKSARPHENLAVVEQFCARLDVLPFAERAASHYGQLWAELERAGQPIGIHDMMIGGHACSEGLTVVSNNVREFRRMPGLRLENWLSSSLLSG